ncbi:MAG: hypothetical protein QOJ57_1477, partial [Thermoleophilaceae bacterium]|nr:hypothetical protein [Thermoleophilaceae bacterium]
MVSAVVREATTAVGVLALLLVP